MLHVMDGGRASPLYRHPVREAVEGYTVNRVYRISRIGLYRVYRIRLHLPKFYPYAESMICDYSMMMSERNVLTSEPSSQLYLRDIYAALKL